MAKTTTPILSFKAHGSLANTMTYQKKGSQTLVRAKPIPTNRGSLAQCYQRWLYQDYMYRFTQLSAAQKAALKAAATPKNWTPLAQYLFTYLTPRTNLLGWWRLDEPNGGTAFDSSPYKKNGTAVGTTPITGVISKARYFDGLDDRISIGAVTNYKLTTAITMEAFIKCASVTTNGIVCGKAITIWTNLPYAFVVQPWSPLPYCSAAIKTNLGWTYAEATFSLGVWHHIAMTWSGTLKFYLDGVLKQQNNLGGTLSTADAIFRIGRAYSAAYYFKGDIDDVALWDVVLPAEELKLHAQRRHA